MNGLLLLPKRIARLIAAERSRYLPNETGGFLIGIRRGPHVEVTNLTKQGPGDVFGYASFERACRSHADAIHAAWRESEHFESLIGDWHSHPIAVPVASRLDHAAWRTLARTSRRPIVGLIDAGQPFPNVYFMHHRWPQRGAELLLAHEDDDNFTFALGGPRENNGAAGRRRIFTAKLGLDKIRDKAR